MPNKAQNGQIKKFNVCTLETQMSKYRGDFKSKGNPKFLIKTPVRTKFKKSSFLVNTVYAQRNTTHDTIREDTGNTHFLR